MPAIKDPPCNRDYRKGGEQDGVHSFGSDAKGKHQQGGVNKRRPSCVPGGAAVLAQDPRDYCQKMFS